MANLIRQQKLIDNQKRALIKYTMLIDTAVANSTLIDVSSLNYALNANGYILGAGSDRLSNYRTTIKRVFGSAKANAYIKLQWQGSANSEIITIPSGSFDFDFQSMGDGAIISNPETSSNGNILITVITPSSADTATVFLDLRKDNRDYDAGQSADPVAFNRGRAAP